MMIPIRGLLFAVGLGAIAPALGGECVGQPPAVPVDAPQSSLLRAYPFDFRTPIRLAVDTAGTVYVADSQRREVMVRSADGRILHRQGVGGRPGPVAVDSGGRLYVADLDSGEIAQFDVDWRISRVFGGSEIVRPGDIAIDDASGRLYVSDSESHRVWVFSDAGTPLFSFGDRGAGDGQFEYPSGVFFDGATRELLVADQLGYRIQVFDPDGGWLYCIGGSSANPGGIFQRGRLLAAPQGLWSDASGRIFVADSFDGQVKVIDRGGRLLARIGDFGTARGQLRIPSDLVLDGFGRLFVASTNNARLEVFGIDTFTDPELYAPARLTWSPTLIDASETGRLSASFDIPGHRLPGVDPNSIRVNGVTPVSVQTIGDANSGRQLLALFDRRAILPTLPATGQGTIRLNGDLPGLSFEAQTEVEIIGNGPLDTDADGIADAADECPESPGGSIVDDSGCSIAQYCACDQADTHGLHVRCVARTATRFSRAGLIERAEARQVVRQAARGECGRNDWKRHRDEDHRLRKARNPREQRSAVSSRTARDER